MKKFYQRHFVFDHVWMLFIIILFARAVYLGWNHLLTGTIPNAILFIIVLGVAVLMSIVFILILGVFIFTLWRKDYMSNILEYCKNNRSLMEELEADSRKADKVGWRIRSGEQWIFYIDNDSMPNIIRKDVISSVEYNIESRGRYSTQYTYCHKANGKIVKIPCSRRNYKKLEGMFGRRPMMIPMLSNVDSKRTVSVLIFTFMAFPLMGVRMLQLNLHENRFFTISVANLSA